MNDAPDLQTSKHWQTILWVLRITVAVQCLGNWRWFTQIEETPLLHWLIHAADVGGLGWQESTALLTQQVVGWLVLLAGVVVLWRPLPILLGMLTLLQILIAVAMWRNADGYALQSQWLPPHLLMLFPLATQLMRIVAPLGLMFLYVRNKKLTYEESKLQSVFTLLRWSVAIVFLSHGIEAWQHNPKFLDLLIGASQRVLGLSVPQVAAEHVLTVVGGMDMLLATACLGFRSKAAMWWMAVWGGITAFSRIAALGWSPAWHESFTRIPHLGIPLAVALWWRLIEYRASASPAESPQTTS